MCKILLNKGLLIAYSLIWSYALSSQSLSELKANRDITLHQSVEEELYLYALSQESAIVLPMSEDVIQVDRIKSYLYSRYPELAYQIESTSQQILSQSEISRLLIAHIDQQAADGTLDIDGSLYHQVVSSLKDEQSIAILKYLQGYELFKLKRLKEAQKKFEPIIQLRKGPYEYAQYYSGLAFILTNDYSNAIKQLSAIRNTEALKDHIPYYLIAAHYGHHNYREAINTYQRHKTNNQLYNNTGIIKIVAYSYYHLQNDPEVISNINLLSQMRPLSDEEKYILGKSLLRNGEEDSASTLITAIGETEEQNELSKTAAYEQALYLSQQGKFEEAIGRFQVLLESDLYDREDIQHNLNILYTKTHNYDLAAVGALDNIKGKYSNESLNMLSTIIDQIHNPKTYNKVIKAIQLRSHDKSSIKTSLYNKAVSALQSGNKELGQEYFELLKEVDPLIEERGAVAAWKGIIAYQEGDYNRAQSLLANFINSQANKSTASPANKELEFNAHYFLAYTYFRSKNHQRALGHFSKCLTLNSPQKEPNVMEDLHLRLGDVYFLMDKYKDALISYNAVQKMNLEHKPYALWQEAVIAELQNRPYDQLLLLDEIINAYPKSKYYTKSVFGAANTLFALGKYDKAALLYNNLQNTNAPIRMQEEAIVQLGLISVNAGDYATAEKYYQHIISSSKDSEMQQRAHLALKEIYADYTYDTDAYIDLIKKEDDTNTLVEDQVIYELAYANFESKNDKEAIQQWSKLISEYPASQRLQESHYHIGLAYQRLDQIDKAATAFQSAVALGASSWSMKAYDQLELITYDINKDPKAYLTVLQNRKSSYTEYKLTGQQLYRAATSAIQIEDSKLALEYGVSLYNQDDINPQDKNQIVEDLTILLMKHKQWPLINQLEDQPNLKAYIAATPKMIYTRSLAYMNRQMLEKAAQSISDSYDILLNHPAWLAKCIILLSDIHVLENDKDSAIAALQALIETKSQVPEALIEIAKSRLNIILPDN